MNDVLRQKLCEVLAAHGRRLIDDRPRCEALLWLAAGEDTRGMFALLGALERKVPHAILTAPPDRRGEELLAKLTRRLVADLDTQEAAARWAVESWALAVAAAPDKPLAPAEPEPRRPLPPAPRPQPPPEFADLPPLSVDDGPPPPAPLPREAVKVNLDPYFGVGGQQGTFLRDDTAGVTCLACAPGGNALATGHEDHTVRLWDAGTGELKAVLTGHTAAVRAVAFSPGGRMLASAGADGAVRVWDVSARAERVTLTGHKGAVSAAAFSPDGKALASGGEDGLVRVWDPVRGTLQATL